MLEPWVRIFVSLKISSRNCFTFSYKIMSMFCERRRRSVNVGGFFKRLVKSRSHSQIRMKNLVILDLFLRFWLLEKKCRLKLFFFYAGDISHLSTLGLTLPFGWMQSGVLAFPQRGLWHLNTEYPGLPHSDFIRIFQFFVWYSDVLTQN